MKSKNKKQKSDEGSMAVESADLKAVIKAHSAFFDRLVNLIPARFYLPSGDEEKPWFQGLSKQAKAAFKAQTRAHIKAARRNRLDPSAPSSTLHLLSDSLLKTSAEADANVDADASTEVTDDVRRDEDVEKPAPAEGERVVSYEELQERLRKRIEDLRSKRNTRPESQNKQRKEKKKRGKSSSKKELKLKKTKEESNKTNDSGKRKRDDSGASVAAAVPTDISFGKIKIDGDEGRKKKRKLSKEAELAKAKKLGELKKDPEKGQAMSWKTAEKRAAGLKVHDNPKLLKESIKRDKKKRKKSAEQWKGRTKGVTKEQMAKQQKRRENIRGRIEDKRMRRIEKREKKLMRPGFEGRKQGYINE